MARPKGAKNKEARPLAPASCLAPEQRIIFLANAIVDKLIEDQAIGKLVIQNVGTE